MRHVDISATIQVYGATEEAYSQGIIKPSLSVRLSKGETLWKGRV